MKALLSLKKSLNQNKLIVQREEGYIAEEIFHFFPRASEKEINKLPEYTPKDLIAFLRLHNGADLFVHPENGGGTHLFSVEEIVEHQEIWDCPEGFTPIGTGMDGLWIVCQTENRESERNFIWIGEFMSFEDEFEKTSLDFSTWFERFILAQGSSFWEWGRE
nr:SMI1/KNR4 family protein [Jeotgalibacillus proteolyticus]